MTGLAVGAPVVLTIWLVWTAILMIDGRVIPFIPLRTLPSDSILRVIPGVGVLIFFVATVLTGLMARGLLGRWFVRLWDRAFNRLPVVRVIYSSLKQITQVVLGQDVEKFETACLVRFPHEHAWAIGFVSTKAQGEIKSTLSAQSGSDEILSVFVPTTPNPTSGFLIFVARRDIIALDMGVDDAVKLAISAGLVYPEAGGNTAVGASPGEDSMK